ncbi:hypothetical protein IBX73_09615, partial [candidate division WOR-3 bacterium]|nr:hypothetical protein [candidate division WOR-3 bacterium]
SIVNITYIDSLFKLVLEVDSFFFHDEVEVQLSDGIKDLAGKSLKKGHSKETCIAWTEVGMMESVPKWHISVLPDVIISMPGRTQSNCAKVAQFSFHDCIGFFEKAQNPDIFVLA